MLRLNKIGATLNEAVGTVRVGPIGFQTKPKLVFCSARVCLIVIIASVAGAAAFSVSRKWIFHSEPQISIGDHEIIDRVSSCKRDFGGRNWERSVSYEREIKSFLKIFQVRQPASVSTF